MGVQPFFPGYTLLEQVHLGNETVVYRARRSSDGVSVMIKLPRHKSGRPRDVARLRHEHAILEDLGVPGVVSAYGIEPFERGCALILEDIEGRPLSQILRGGKLPVARALEIARSVAVTLAALHERAIIHKDVQPQNIMIEPDGGARLIDFGIAARLSQEVQSSVQIDALEGTLAFISPEQTGRMNRVIDHRTDMYSLGVTLYCMLTGELPFTATTPTEIVHSHIARAPPEVHVRAPEVPAMVSRLVVKLMAKAAEDRYQTARGLVSDLDACLCALAETGAVAAFSLGRHDVSAELSLTQKLYGRAAELAELLAAFDRAGHGASELLLVAGYSGVGKSALVHEIHKPIARRGGYFVSGKFDQFSRSVPYAPLARAFRDLIRQILTEPEPSLAAFKEAILAAVEDNGRLLIDLIPELELVIGPQPPVQELGPSEAQRRQNLLFQRFLRVFCAPEHPLVIFLDDLQWVDPATLKMLQSFLTDEEHRHLLIISAYRDNEVDAAHPLALALSELRDAGASIREIRVAPLGLAHVTELLVDALRRGAHEVAPLARLVRDKTHGNPFFLTQLLRSLHKARLITLDRATESFRWDIGGIERASVSDNVVEFMVDKLRRLSPATQQVMKLAACIGHSFDLRTLAVIHERPQQETASALWEALAEGVVLPQGGDYRLVPTKEVRPGSMPPPMPPPMPSPAPPPAPELSVAYRFLHDRVQQAAYLLIEGGQDLAVHLRIGRLMLAGASPELLEEQIFDIASHLNRGSPLIEDPDERLTLARLNLAAGVKAKASTAYESASDYLCAGIALLPDRCWESDYELAFALHLERAQCEELAVRKELAERLFDELLGHARTRLDRTRVQTLRVVHFTAKARYRDALAAARDAAALFGMSIPEDERQWAPSFFAELALLGQHLAGRRPAELVDLPVMSDPELSALVRLLAYVSPCAFFIHKMLIALITALMVRVSLEHGNADGASIGYVKFGIIVSALFGRYAEGYQYGLLALDLNEKTRDVEFTGRVYELVNAHLAYFINHLRTTIEGLERGYRAAQSVGDLAYIAYITYQLSIARFGLGEDLVTIAETSDRYLAITTKIKDEMSTAFHRIIKQCTACLLGRTEGPLSLSDGSFDEASFIASLDEKGIGLPSCWYHLTKAKILFLHERYEEALAMVIGAEARSVSSLGLYHTTPIPFYACLIRLALYPGASPQERARHDAEIDQERAKIALWAESCPENFRYRLLLIDAERARVAGRADAVGLYKRSIDEARANGYTHHEAIANELCARFYRDLGDPVTASVYRTDAHAAYGRWGAVAKVAQLEAAHPELLLRDALRTAPPGALSRQTIASDALDLSAIVRAAQVIAGETTVPQVVDRLMRLALTGAGAQRAVLLLAREERLVVAAMMSLDPERVEVDLDEPIEERADLPRSLLDFVARTREPVALAEAAEDPRFGADPAIVARRPRSVLCVPLAHKSRLRGMLYLEHAAASDVFVPSRVEVLGLISAQAAIALENATLLEQAELAHEAVHRANGRLEEQIAERTEQLRRSNDELADANERLLVELEQRTLAERDRAELQEQIIAAQEERMAEMSTPFIPITDDIMVMPLIGALDAQRASQVMESALRGAQSFRARAVILDVTGIRQAHGAAIAETLIRTSSALRLLGTEVILSGLRSDTARALVDVAADLRDMTICGTLQSAVARALERGRHAHGAGR